MSGGSSPNNGTTIIPHAHSMGTAVPGISDKALSIGTLVGEFRVMRLLGEGGFGIVYLAHDQSLDRMVALKEYMPSDLANREDSTTVKVKSHRHADTFAAGLRSFINEARLLAQFDHPSLVKVHRFFQANGTAYMAMPYYKGTTLKQTLAERDYLPDEAWLVKLLTNLLDALEIIHSRDCYHRDISPDNILMLHDDTPVLLDFGAARQVIGGMTHALTVILKPGYAPIEQYAEDAGMSQGPWTDVYALASVGYFAITREPPVPAISRIVTDRLVPLATRVRGQYSDRFLRVIDHAMSLRPENRPQSVAEFRQSLGEKDTRRSRTPQLHHGAIHAEPAAVPPAIARFNPEATRQPSRLDSAHLDVTVAPLPRPLRDERLAGPIAEQDARVTTARAGADAGTATLDVSWQRKVRWALVALLGVLALGAGLIWMNTRSSDEVKSLQAQLRSKMEALDAERQRVGEAAAEAVRDVEQTERRLHSAITTADKWNVAMSFAEAKKRAQINKTVREQFEAMLDGSDGQRLKTQIALAGSALNENRIPDARQSYIAADLEIEVLRQVPARLRAQAAQISPQPIAALEGKWTLNDCASASSWTTDGAQVFVSWPDAGLFRANAVSTGQREFTAVVQWPASQEGHLYTYALEENRLVVTDHHNARSATLKKC